VKKKKKKQPPPPPPPPLQSRYFEVGTHMEPVAIPSTSAEYETAKPRFTMGESLTTMMTTAMMMVMIGRMSAQ